MNTAELEVIPSDQSKIVVTGPGAVWAEFRSKLKPLVATHDEVKKKDPSDPLTRKMAKATRLAAKTIRCGAENKRVELVADMKRAAKVIDESSAAVQREAEVIEDAMREIEEHAERLEAERKEALWLARTKELAAYVTNTAAYNLAEMAEPEYRELLAGSKLAHEAKLQKAREEAEAAAAKAKAEAEERERIRLENLRLKQEAEEREAAVRIEREKAEAERREAEHKARLEREAIEAKAKADREAAEKKLKEEAAARAKVEAELRAKQEAEEKAKRDAEKAARKAAAAPDRAKLAAYATALSQVPVPEMATKDGRNALGDIRATFQRLIGVINTHAEAL